jgi:hypothetical protein
VPLPSSAKGALQTARVPRGVLLKHGVMLTRAKKTFADLDKLLQFILTNYGESWFNARN